MKKWIVLIMTLLLATVVVACGDDNNAEGNKDSNQEEQQEQGNTGKEGEKPKKVEITDKEKVSEDEVVASVNGEEIKGDRYNPTYSQLKITMGQYNQDVSDLNKLKKQTIEMLITQHLINTDAAKKGIEVTEKEVQKEFDKIKKENEDRLKTALEQFQMDEEQFKAMLKDNIITTEYTDKEFDVKVSDKEVKEYYNKIKEQSEEVAKLDDLEEQIKTRLEQEKASEQLQKRIDDLKKDAEIKTLL
ncbi:SurA N-terminal domain-containing protein [Cerasibacillus sp. JNUCC 74]